MESAAYLQSTTWTRGIELYVEGSVYIYSTAWLLSDSRVCGDARLVKFKALDAWLTFICIDVFLILSVGSVRGHCYADATEWSTYFNRVDDDGEFVS